ncbi:hypothetical protein BGX38DRAFT_801253 [Terfezia claveryi]|nr:hypothetical protein BGX38DRAFT_801253 [Terfezia claveryi]
MQLRRRRMVEQSKGKCLARDRRNCTLWISYFKQRDKKRLGRARPSLPTIFSVVLSFLPVNQFIPRSSMVTGCMVCLCVLCFLRCIFSSYFARQVSYNTSADLIIVVGGPWEYSLNKVVLHPSSGQNDYTYNRNHNYPFHPLTTSIHTHTQYNTPINFRTSKAKLGGFGD